MERFREMMLKIQPFYRFPLSKNRTTGRLLASQRPNTLLPSPGPSFFHCQRNHKHQIKFMLILVSVMNWKQSLWVAVWATHRIQIWWQWRDLMFSLVSCRAADWSGAVLAAWHIPQLSCRTLNVDGTITAQKKKKKRVINVIYKGNISCCSNADFSFQCLFLQWSTSFLVSVASKIASICNV